MEGVVQEVRVMSFMYKEYERTTSEGDVVSGRLVDLGIAQDLPGGLRFERKGPGKATRNEQG